MLSGTVAENAGAVQPGKGQEVNVTILGDNVVIDAVVVKGGNGYNVYEDPTFLPPALQPPQHYISPFNNGGNIPAISHWFLCYGPTQQQPQVTPPSADATGDCDVADFTLNAGTNATDFVITITLSAAA